MSRNAYLRSLILFLVAVIIWSWIDASDRPTWWLEAIPVLIGLPVILFTYSKHPLTTLLYTLLFIHSVILLVGAHYTYAEVPLGDWFKNWFELSRNHYDRIGHVAQGFIPAILAREILLRNNVLKHGIWLFVVVTCICLAFSAFYELIEWWVAISFDEGASQFLAMQGDVWDTQWDMFLALLGAMSALLLLSNWHDKQLQCMGIIYK